MNTMVMYVLTMVKPYHHGKTMVKSIMYNGAPSNYHGIPRYTMVYYASLYVYYGKFSFYHGKWYGIMVLLIIIPWYTVVVLWYTTVSPW